MEKRPGVELRVYSDEASDNLTWLTFTKLDRVIDWSQGLRHLETSLSYFTDKRLSFGWKLKSVANDG